jgi:hypothetical protein
MVLYLLLPGAALGAGIAVAMGLPLSAGGVVGVAASVVMTWHRARQTRVVLHVGRIEVRNFFKKYSVALPSDAALTDHVFTWGKGAICLSLLAGGRRLPLNACTLPSRQACAEEVRARYAAQLALPYPPPSRLQPFRAALGNIRGSWRVDAPEGKG